MCDFFENGDFMDEDEYDADTEMDDPLDGDSDLDGEPDEVDDLTVDAFYIGGAMGFGYEEGLIKRKRRKRKSFSDDSERL